MPLETEQSTLSVGDHKASRYM